MARILYVSQGYTTHDRRFLEQLSTTPHDIWFLPCAADRVQYESRPIPSGVHRLPSLNNGSGLNKPINWAVSLSRFRRLLRTIKPDLVHAGPVQTGGFIAAMCRCHPLLVMSWGSDVLTVPEKSRWSRWVTQFTLRQADMVLGDCRAVRDAVLALAPLKPDQIVCFPWGLDLRRSLGRSEGLGLQRKLGWEGCRVVISSRSFEPIHGTLVFLEGMRRVMEQQPDVRVIMLGDGSLRPHVEAFISEHDLSSRFHLPGQVPEPLVRDYFAEADLYVSTTLSDGSSISLLEAMASGLPVVVTDAHGNREWVRPGLNGWLCPPGQAGALAAAVIEALSDEAPRRAMGEANIALIRERADWEHNFGRLLMAYRTLLAGVRRRRENTHGSV